MKRLGQIHRRARRGDRGAVLIEFALIAPVLIIFMLGILEYGNAYRQVGALERAAQQGGRAVSSQGDGRFADYEGLRAVDASTRGLSGITVDRVVIFDATGTDGTVPAACLTASSASLRCNSYSGNQVRTTNPSGFSGGTSSNPACSTAAWDAAWCPVDRPRNTTNRVRVGVHIVVTYRPVTGLIPADITMEQTSVYQIEPCAQGQTSC